MKKILLISSIVVSSLGIVNAQVTESKPQPFLKPAQVDQLPASRAKVRVSEIAKITPLQAEQTTKLVNLYVSFFTKSDDLKAKKATLDGAEYGKQMSALKSERDAGLKAVLTPAQITTLENAKAEMTKDGAAKPKE